MNGRIWIGTSFSVAMILLMSGQSVHAQMLRLRKTGAEPQRLNPIDARKLAATESQAFPVKPDFEMPVKVAIKPTVNRAHYEPRQQRALRRVIPATNGPAQPAEPNTEVTPPNELHFEPPTREAEFELPRVLPKDNRQPVKPNDDALPSNSPTNPTRKRTDAPPEPTTLPSEFELPSEPEQPSEREPELPSELELPSVQVLSPLPSNKVSLIQPPDEEPSPQTTTTTTVGEQPSEETIETLPAAPTSVSQPAEEQIEVQPAKPKSAAPPATSGYEEPVIIPMPRTAKAESVTPIHLPRLDEIDVRDATRLKPTRDGSSSIQSPENQAQLRLGMRPPVYYGASAWPGFQLNRNTYPFCHKPLYFENPNLERCGFHYGCLTTPVSMAFFYGTIPTLPYRHGAEPPWECVGSLPDCRYGHRFGHDAYLPPLSLRGAALQAAATVGMIYAVP